VEHRIALGRVYRPFWIGFVSRGVSRRVPGTTPTHDACCFQDGELVFSSDERERTSENEVAFDRFRNAADFRMR